jgi:hypothetical protein
MAESPPELQRLLDRVAREVRWRRAERGAWRGAFWGAVIAAVLLALQAWTGLEEAVTSEGVRGLALAVLLAATLAGAMLLGLRKVSPLAAARIADRTWGLQDRLATAIEYSLPATAQPQDEPTQQAMARAQLADAIAAATPLAGEKRRIVPRSLPREARWILLPLGVFCALSFLPPLPAPAALMQAAAPGKARDERSVSLVDRVKLLGEDLLRRQPTVAPEVQRAQEQPQQQAQNEAAEFKDKALSRKDVSNVDFASFAKKGDERLKLLDRADKLPDLQSDFASSQYRTMAKRAQELAAAKGGPMNSNKLNQVLREMEKMGRKNNAEWSDEVSQAMQNLEDGDAEGAMQGLQQALGKMQQAEAKQMASRMLQGGRDNAQGDRAGSGGESGEQQRFGSEGGFAEKGSGGGQGTPTARLRSTPYDAAISGARKGRGNSMDTQMSNRPGSFGAQLQFRGEVGQYRRQMEDAIAREQVPRDYHSQIRDYFKSLQE